eukprot:426227-Prymnesium_polylepis.2
MRLLVRRVKRVSPSAALAPDAVTSPHSAGHPHRTLRQTRLVRARRGAHSHMNTLSCVASNLVRRRAGHA